MLGLANQHSHSRMNIILIAAMARGHAVKDCTLHFFDRATRHILRGSQGGMLEVAPGLRPVASLGLPRGCWLLGQCIFNFPFILDNETE